MAEHSTIGVDGEKQSVWTLAELLRRAGLAGEAHWQPERAGADDEPTVLGVTDDSRRVTRGTCFVAVGGDKFDGHRFVSEAVDRGATSIVAERAVTAPERVTVVRVPDSRGAAARMAAAFYGVNPGGARALQLVGVTGTNGKTTVAWMIRQVLEAGRYPTAVLGTVGYDLVGERMQAPLTTPGAVDLCGYLAQAHGHGATHAVFEVSSHALEQRRVDGLGFAVGVFTNLSGDHLDYHGTMERYFSAKRRLFERLDEAATAVLNLDDAYGRVLVGVGRGKVVGYTLGTDGEMAGRAAVCAEEVVYAVTGTRLTLRLEGGRWKVSSRMVGAHNVSNMLAAAGAGLALGVSGEAIADGLSRMEGVPGRLERVDPSGWPYSVFVDYAHTDDALERVLSVLRPLTRGRVICVFGCGGDRDRTKRPRMARVAEAGSDIVVVTSDNPRTEDPLGIIGEIAAGFCGGRPRENGSKVQIEPDRAEAIGLALSLAGEGDAVLIAGKGHEDYQIVGDRVLPFDDRRVAQQWMGLKGSLAG